VKELLTRRFWEGVKKTFNEALEDPQVKTDPDVPAEAEAKEVSAPGASAKGHDLGSGSRGADTDISLGEAK